MTAWQLSPVAGVGREIVHRIVGPFLGLLVGGPRIEGTEWLTDLPRPLLICPNHESHLDIPVLRRALGRQGSTPSRHRRGRRLLVPAAGVSLAGVVVRRRAVPADRPGRRVDPRGRGVAGRRLARRDLPRGNPQPDRRDGHVQGGRRARRGARRRPRPARPDRRAVGDVAARGAAAASPRQSACASANRWWPRSTSRHARSPSASKRPSARSGAHDPWTLTRSGRTTTIRTRSELQARGLAARRLEFFPLSKTAQHGLPTSDPPATGARRP